MIPHLLPSLVRLLVPAIVVFAAQAALGALKVGDAAPKLAVGSWVQGEAVTEFEGDKVYLVEFWATWCGPCVAAIPHLNEVQQKFKDRGLVVIGQNLGEDAATIKAFVNRMGSKMTYRVTKDDTAGGDKGRMARTWLAAAGQNGIPCGFVVSKQGKIAYIGHPMSLKESLLESLLAEPSTKPAAPSGPAADTATAPSPKVAELARRAGAELAANQLDQAESTIAELNRALSENFRHLGGLLELELILARKQSDDAIQLSKILREDFAKNPAVLNGVAARLVAAPDASSALCTAAAKIATPISTAAGDQQAQALATLARIAWLGGDQARAVELQTKAVAVSAKADLPARQALLDTYQQGPAPAAGK